MTEEEWLAATDFYPLHEYLFHAEKRRPRKYRLIANGICRHFLGDSDDKHTARVLDLTDAYADNSELEDLVRAEEVQIGRHRPHGWGMLVGACEVMSYGVFTTNETARTLSFAQDWLYEQWRDRTGPIEDEAEWELLSRDVGKPANVIGAILVREVFGNPFRPLAFDPRWQTETVVALATGIYAERAFDRMPILADALEDAGCDHADILAHCRGDGPHVRGCWVVDLILGKS